MTNWPDPARPGVPLNPERDGWHFLLMNNGTLNPTCWRAKGFWVDPPGCSGPALPEVVALWNSYVAPALTPDEAAALQKRAADLEAKLNLLMGPPPDKVSLRAGMIAACVSEKTADEILRSPAFNRAALGGKDA